MKVPIIKDVLEYNKEHANINRDLFKKKDILVINLLSSPGAGKTTLIISTIELLKNKYNIGVIEGDISSTYDADKIKKYIDAVVQVNTGGTCHLNASMIAKALKEIDLENIDILFIENVGNLICPVGFDLGEDYKVVLSSVNEGDDKPIKYPNIFAKSDLVLLNKTDILENSDFDIALFENTIKELKYDSTIFKVSAKTGKGLKKWAQWLELKIKKAD